MHSIVVSPPVADHRGELRGAARETSRWRHRSATGAELRSCVLPELSAAALASRRTVRLQVQLLDPGDESAWRRYQDWARPGVDPDAQRQLQIEIYATVLAVCLQRKANRRLLPRIRFSAFAAARQLDLTDDQLFLTEPGRPERAVPASLREQSYERYEREFDDGWSQAKPTDLKLQAVDWSPLDDGGSIARYKILNLFRELALPTPAFTGGELDAIVERLNGHETCSDDPSGGVDSA